MTSLVFWKALFDQAFCYTFLGSLGAFFGARLWPMVLAGWLAALGAVLSFRLKERGQLRLLPLALPLLALLSPGLSLAEALPILAGTGYGLFAAYRQDYLPDYDRQTELFGVYWKALLALIVVGILFGQVEGVTAVTLPWGALGAACSVLLTRSLRHDPEVLSDRAFRLWDLVTVLSPALLALLLSSKPFLAGCAGILGAVYDHLIAPALNVLFLCVGAVIYGLVWLFSLLIKSGEQEEIKEMPDFGAGQEQFKELQEAVEGEAFWQGIIALAALAALAVVLILLFRRLARRGQVWAVKTAPGEFRTYAPPRQPQAEEEDGSADRRVRGQYRRFLRLCQDKGIPLQPSDTSGDIDQRAGRRFDPQPAGELRQLYLKARYAHRADTADAHRAKELVGELKKGS